MALKQPQRKSTFNTFEVFSDLVFCTLVLVLVLVLFLAVGVDRRAEAVAADRSAVDTRLADVEAQEQAMQARLANLQTTDTQVQALTASLTERQAELAKREDELSQRQARLDRLLGTFRYTATSGPPRLVVAYVWDDAGLRVQPVPTALLERFKQTTGMDEAQKAEYFRSLRQAFLELAEPVPALSPEQYRAIRRGVVQAKPASGEPLGLEESYRTDLSMVVSGAVHPDYRYKWDDPERVEALFEKIRGGEAYRTLWGEGQGPQPPQALARLPILYLDVEPRSGRVLINREPFDAAQVRRLLESIGGGALAVEYRPRLGPVKPPAWLLEQVLKPTGYVHTTPMPEPLTPSP